MTQQIKPKQCGENTWYIPNQKGFVPKIGGHYYYCQADSGVGIGKVIFASDYAMIDS